MTPPAPHLRHDASPETPRTYLVTGGAGFIGSCFVELLIEKGHHAIVLDALTYAGSTHNLGGFSGPGSHELIQGDIGDGALVLGLLDRHRPEAILNFAAESHVDRSISAPSAFVRTNIQGTFTLLNAALDYYGRLEGARKAAFTYLQISTDEVYGSLGPTGKFSETTSYAPNSPYSASKAAADHLVRAWHHTFGLPTLTTNCSNNYGPRQFPEKLIPTMITCALDGKPLPVYGDGGNVRDWIHVRDHCEGIYLAIQKGRRGETYCFGGDAERGNLDVVRAICTHLDRLRPRADGKSHSAAIQFVKDRAGHDRRYAIDDAKARRDLGFARKHDFDSGLADTVRWYLEHGAWIQAVMGKKSSKGGL